MTVGLIFGVVLIVTLLVSTRGSPLEIRAAVFVFLGIFMFVVLRINCRKLHRSFESYELHVSDNALLRRQQGYPDVEIPFAEIRSIRQASKGIGVTHKDKKRAIGIPAGLAGFEEASSLIRTAVSVDFDDTPSVFNNPALLMGASLLPVLGIVVVFAMEDPAVVVPLAVVVDAALLWSVYYSWRSPLLSRKLKLQVTLGLFPALAVAYRAWILWSDQ